MTRELASLDRCEAMLCYLNALTWASGGVSEAFAAEIASAMSRGVPLLLVHEMPGEGQEARNGVPFGTFFASDATPVPLIKAGIYATIAVALKGGAWREASQVLMTQALGMPPRRGDIKEIRLWPSSLSSLRQEPPPPSPLARLPTACNDMLGQAVPGGKSVSDPDWAPDSCSGVSILSA